MGHEIFRRLLSIKFKLKLTFCHLYERRNNASEHSALAAQWLKSYLTPGVTKLDVKEDGDSGACCSTEHQPLLDQGPTFYFVHSKDLTVSSAAIYSGGMLTLVSTNVGNCLARMSQLPSERQVMMARCQSDQYLISVCKDSLRMVTVIILKRPSIHFLLLIQHQLVGAVVLEIQTHRLGLAGTKIRPGNSR